MISVYQTGIHCGEEPWVPGNARAGMIVFSGCHLKCSYCYTPEASRHRRPEHALTEDAWKTVCQQLTERGATNLNLITPSHGWRTLEPWITDYSHKPDALPLVLKITGYEAPTLIDSMAAVATHFVFDFKAATSAAALAVALPGDYGAVASRAIARAQEHGAPTTVRHLLVPGQDIDSQSVVRKLAEIGFAGRLNLMTLFAAPGRVIRASAARVDHLVALATSFGISTLVNGREPHVRVAA